MVAGLQRRGAAVAGGDAAADDADGFHRHRVGALLLAGLAVGLAGGHTEGVRGLARGPLPLRIGDDGARVHATTGDGADALEEGEKPRAHVAVSTLAQGFVSRQLGLAVVPRVGRPTPGEARYFAEHAQFASSDDLQAALPAELDDVLARHTHQLIVLSNIVLGKYSRIRWAVTTAGLAVVLIAAYAAASFIHLMLVEILLRTGEPLQLVELLLLALLESLLDLLTLPAQDGNKLVEGKGNFPRPPMEVALGAMPVWIAGAAAPGGSIWIAVLLLLPV